MRTLALHLEAGSDVRESLETLAGEQGAPGYVLSVVGNLSAAVFQCPGRSAPTRLRGELEIITLTGTLSPEGVHLHLSFSDGDCRVWGGHLESGTVVLRGADLLLGFLDPVPASALSGSVSAVAEPAPFTGASDSIAAPRLEVAVLSGCPWSARALRLLRTLSIPHRVITADREELRREVQQRSGSASLPQVFLDGEPVGGYDALAELHGRGALDALR
ncbi:MAG: PCC domain-containing protein [Cyanobium sp.]